MKFRWVLKLVQLPHLTMQACSLCNLHVERAQAENPQKSAYPQEPPHSLICSNRWLMLLGARACDSGTFTSTISKLCSWDAYIYAFWKSILWSSSAHCTHAMHIALWQLRRYGLFGKCRTGISFCGYQRAQTSLWDRFYSSLFPYAGDLLYGFIFVAVTRQAQPRLACVMRFHSRWSALNRSSHGNGKTQLLLPMHNEKLLQFILFLIFFSFCLSKKCVCFCSKNRAMSCRSLKLKYEKGVKKKKINKRRRRWWCRWWLWRWRLRCK